MIFKFKSKELEAYDKSLKFSKNRLTKTNLFFSKWSNNFGRDWGRGILFTVIVAIWLYFLYACFTFGFTSKPSFDNLQFHLKYLIKFLSPIHKFTEFKDYENVVSVFFDYLGRIFVAYGIYQTVTAFRKLGK